MVFNSNHQVFLPISNRIKFFWIQIVVGNCNKLVLGAYCRPHIDDQHSIDELSLSLQKLNETTTDTEV